MPFDQNGFIDFLGRLKTSFASEKEKAMQTGDLSGVDALAGMADRAHAVAVSQFGDGQQDPGQTQSQTQSRERVRFIVATSLEYHNQGRQ